MTLSVTSWFVEQTRQRRAAPQRRFTLGASDYSHDVLRWPTLRYQAGTIDLGTTTLLLSNMEREFQFMVDCDAALVTSCELSLGFSHPGSGTEWISLYQGAPTHAAFSRGGTELRLQLQGKTKRLTDTALGTDTESGGLDFTTSGYYPSDLAWTLVTCYGGLSTLAGSANPDIQYGEWVAWRDTDVRRDIRVKAYLTGEKIYQVLNTLALMDSRVIAFQNGRLRFRDTFPPYGTSGEPLGAEHLLDLQLSRDPERVINHFFVEAGYDAAKSRFMTQYTQVNSRSQQAFGRRSGRFSSRGVWFASAGDGRYLAEDQVYFHGRPHAEISARTPLAGGLLRSVGDVAALTHSHFSLSGRLCRIVEQAVDLENGAVDLRLEEASHRPWQFQEAVSSFELAVGTLEALEPGEQGMVGEQTDGRFHRTDGTGRFHPTGVNARVFLPLNASEVLFGGPPFSGAGTAVLQRSSDGGSSSVVVHTLAPGIDQVHDLFEVGSGTHLASTGSCGILRSIDAGSSWGVTCTVSPGYYLRRFFRPCPGTLWGGTDIEDAGTGLHIWESTNEGITWSPKHTLYTTGLYRTTGWFHLSDSEFLLGYTRPESVQAGVLRGTVTSAGSLYWTSVLSQVSFARIIRTASGHLLFGAEDGPSQSMGTVWRSLDQGSSWLEDARIAKQGIVGLAANSDGTVDALVAEAYPEPRTDRYRNYDPEGVN